MTEVEQALAAWRAGDPLTTGRILYERLEATTRPPWAAAVLRASIEGLAAPALVQATIATARDSTSWSSARSLFARG